MKKTFILLKLLLAVAVSLEAQNVGIGTTTPQRLLHLSGNSELLRIQGGQPWIGFMNNTDPDYRGFIYYPDTSLVFGSAAGTNMPLIIAPNNNGLLFATGTGRVGIGYPNPDSKLQVAGNIKADTFRYNSPKTYYHMIPSVDFSAREAGDSVRKSLGVGYTYINANTPFGWGLTAGLKLPHGARVQQVVAYVIDNSATSNIQVEILGEVASTGGIFNPMPGSNTTGAPGNATLTMNAGPLPFNINNQTAIYYIIVSATSGWYYSDLGVRGIRVEYTLEDL